MIENDLPNIVIKEIKQESKFRCTYIGGGANVHAASLLDKLFVFLF